MNLLPYPRSLERLSGEYILPRHGAFHLDTGLPREARLPVVERVKAAARAAGVELDIVSGPSEHPRPAMRALRSSKAPRHTEGYELRIDRQGVTIHCREAGGLRAGAATLRQLLRQHGRRLPRLIIRDYPDFPRRGIMLDVSRGRVPSLQTLLDLAENLADFKINELQLYTEHTFAYRDYKPVWRDWGALTGKDILRLDARCRELGIDLVPNQNSFGHMRHWLEYPPLKQLAETQEPYEDGGGAFLRYPSTLAPNHPGTLPFLRGLYDELLPHFTSTRFNVGCDETWDLGRGQSKALCEKKGKGRVYLDFLKQIHREVSARGRQMMFWGDIIVHHPELLAELPRDSIALNWGYEAGHPFDREARKFAKAGLPFYVCPGTSTWMTLVGRHDNALANLCEAAQAGRMHGAAGYLITDWGDGGHPQPLAVSYLPYLAGAALSWGAKSFDEKLLVPVLSRDVFQDPSRRIARAAFSLGLAHRRLNCPVPNATPLGAAIAAPPPQWRELVCRDGLKYYRRVSGERLHETLEEIEEQRAEICASRPTTPAGELLAVELELAARMAAHSCKFMLWQQALAAGRSTSAKWLAAAAIRELKRIDKDFRAYWPLRNKGTTEKCSAFLRWRLEDYRRATMPS